MDLFAFRFQCSSPRLPFSVINHYFFSKHNIFFHDIHKIVENCRLRHTSNVRAVHTHTYIWCICRLSQRNSNMFRAVSSLKIDICIDTRWAKFSMKWLCGIVYLRSPQFCRIKIVNGSLFLKAGPKSTIFCCILSCATGSTNTSILPQKISLFLSLVLYLTTISLSVDLLFRVRNVFTIIKINFVVTSSQICTIFQKDFRFISGLIYESFAFLRIFNSFIKQWHFFISPQRFLQNTERIAFKWRRDLNCPNILHKMAGNRLTRKYFFYSLHKITTKVRFFFFSQTKELF